MLAARATHHRRGMLTLTLRESGRACEGRPGGAKLATRARRWPRSASPWRPSASVATHASTPGSPRPEPRPPRMTTLVSVVRDGPARLVGEAPLVLGGDVANDLRRDAAGDDPRRGQRLHQHRTHRQDRERSQLGAWAQPHLGARCKIRQSVVALTSVGWGPQRRIAPRMTVRSHSMRR